MAGHGRRVAAFKAFRDKMVREFANAKFRTKEYGVCGGRKSAIGPRKR